MNAENTFKNKNGETKYYASHRTAWAKAAKLNETAVDGLWLFEADLNGWFVFFVADEKITEVLGKVGA